jgi:hypothetical protein
MFGVLCLDPVRRRAGAIGGVVGKKFFVLCVTAAGLVQPALAEDEIRFAPKAFFNGPGDNVEVSGTVTGAGVGYPNNTNVVSCVKARRECFVITVEAEKNYVSRVTGPGIMAVTSWTDAEIVAQDESMCSRTTISIERKRGEVLWVQEPTNQTKTWCAKSDSRLLRWTIEDPAYYKRVR